MQRRQAGKLGAVSPARRQPRSSHPAHFRIARGPRRIVCLTEEPTEILYALGEQERIVGISAYTVRPPEAKRDKPVVSAFIGGSVKKIEALKPDLIVGFSDIQANLARDLIAANLPVLIFNQRSVQEILDVIVTLGGIVHRGSQARDLAQGYVRTLESVAARSAGGPRPRVYFEEWDEPTITAIEWVGELIEIAGGQNVFADRSRGKLAQERVVTPAEVVASDPELIIGCWCGKPFDRGAFEARPGFGQLCAVRTGQVHEVPPELLLQPGPACLTDGVERLANLISAAARQTHRAGG